LATPATHTLPVVTEIRHANVCLAFGELSQSPCHDDSTINIVSNIIIIILQCGGGTEGVACSCTEQTIVWNDVYSPVSWLLLTSGI